ncbi:MAG: LytTR family DNA-binding domain-containing protein [Bacteroidota bacterium]
MIFSKTMLKVNGNIHFVDPLQILYIRAESSYTVVKLANNEEIKISKNLKYVYAQFLDQGFLFRSHKSFVVNLHFVVKLITTMENLSSSAMIQMSNGEQILLSNRNKASFLSAIRNQGELV